jgi:hypothetical protein
MNAFFVMLQYIRALITAVSILVNEWLNGNIILQLHCLIAWAASDVLGTKQIKCQNCFVLYS